MIVSQEMAHEREKERQLQGQSPQQPIPQVGPSSNIDITSRPHNREAVSLSEEEKDNRAKAIVKHARCVHQSHV